MDVNSIRTSPGVSSAQSVRQTPSVQQSAATQNAAAASSAAIDSDYSVSISDQARVANEVGSLKGLSQDQVDTLKSGIAKAQELMISQMTEQNVKMQGYLDQGIGALNFDGVKVNASQFAMPEAGATPEEAQAAIGEGGDWSVDSVASRIFDMAAQIANGDDERLEKMRDAVEKGFERAGVSFKETTGQEDMPQITKDTHAEIVKRFNDLSEQLAEKKTASDQAAIERLEKANLQGE